MSTPSLTQRFVAKLKARSTLGAADTQAILALPGTVHVARPNADIVSPGQRVEHACLILEGIAGRFEQFDTGVRQVTALHVPGDMCDLHSLLLPLSSWRLQALCGVTYALIPHKDLRQLVGRSPAITEAFWRDTLVDGFIVSRWAVNIGSRKALTRLCHLLCELGLRFELAGIASRMEFELPMSQQHLGEVLALTSVHTNRTLQAARKAGLLRTAQRTIYVNDWDRLAEVGGFSPAYLHIDDPRESAPESRFARA